MPAVHSTARPIHQHDCPECVYYGVFVEATDAELVEGMIDTVNIYDLYQCPASGSYIARFGDMGDYISTQRESVKHYPTNHPLFHLLNIILDNEKAERNRRIAAKHLTELCLVEELANMTEEQMSRL